jgi:hypothetical protein
VSSFPEIGYHVGLKPLLHILKIWVNVAWTRLPILLRLRRRWRRRHLLCFSIRSCSYIITRVFLIIWEGSEWPGEELKRPNPLGLKCDTITSPRRLVNTFIHKMITDLLKRQTYKGGEQL